MESVPVLELDERPSFAAILVSPQLFRLSSTFRQMIVHKTNQRRKLTSYRTQMWTQKTLLSYSEVKMGNKILTLNDIFTVITDLYRVVQAKLMNWHQSLGAL